MTNNTKIGLGADIQKNKVLKFIGSQYLLLIILFLVIISSILSPAFLTMGNLGSLIRQIFILGSVAVGMLFVLLVSGIDISLDGMIPLTTLFLSSFLFSGVNTVVAVILALLIAFCLGLVNGAIVGYGKVNAFVATLGSMTIIKGFSFYYSELVGHEAVIISDKGFVAFSNTTIGPIHASVFIVIAVVVMLHLFLRHTVPGRKIYLVGGNPEAASFVGVNLKKYTMLAFGISGFMAGVTAIMISLQLRMGSPLVGSGYSLDAIAAAVVGGATFTGGKGSVVKAVLGAIVFALLANLLNLLGVPEYPKQMIKGFVVIVAVLVQRNKK